MKSAPKDGTHILISYESFSDNGKTYTGMGRWVDCPHFNGVEEFILNIHEGVPSFRPNPKPHWEVGYVAIIDHTNRYYHGQSYEPRSVNVTGKVLGWMPLPTPPKSRR